MKKLSWILLLFLFVPMHAQEAMRVRDVRQKIDSMHYVMNDYRDSIRTEIKVYKDSVRNVRRHYYDAMPHELRIGMGDQGFESIVWCEKGVPETFPDGYQTYYKQNYRYTQHWFAEYLYNVNYCYGMKCQIAIIILWQTIQDKVRFIISVCYPRCDSRILVRNMYRYIRHWV